MLSAPENQPYVYASLRSLQECVRSLAKRVLKLHSNTKSFANVLLGRPATSTPSAQQDKSDEIAARNFEDIIFHLAQQIDSIDMLTEDVQPHIYNLLTEAQFAKQQHFASITELENKVTDLHDEITQLNSSLRQCQNERDSLEQGILEKDQEFQKRLEQVETAGQ